MCISQRMWADREYLIRGFKLSFCKDENIPNLDYDDGYMAL